MKLDDFDYSLPAGRIAQRPVEPRDAARLMVVHRRRAHFEHRVFRDLPAYLRPGDVLVLNDTRVIPARLRARKTTGGAVEVLLLRPITDRTWETLMRPGRGARRGTHLIFRRGLAGEIVESRSDGVRVVAFDTDRPLMDVAREIGEMPLPPYVREPLARPVDYQTVYAAVDGAVAAPTAGLHFTLELLNRINSLGVRIATLTMHIGAGTFRSVAVDEIEQHRMDAEWYEVSEEAAATINSARPNGLVVAVGTSAVRTLETVAGEDGTVRAAQGWSDLFIYPGYRFNVTDILVTNFHLPKTTLLMLVSAFAGRELILQAYERAVQTGYRFYSFGDAMLIL